MSNRTRIFVAGHRGLVGSAIVRRLSTDRSAELITRPRSELDLRNAEAVDRFFSAERPREVYLAAATVGGIHANSTRPADFIRDNLQIQTNVIDAAWRHGVSKLMFLGSSCIYQRLAQQPMGEDQLLSGPLEPTNEPYAIAKIAGLKMCAAYRGQYGFDAITAMPTNLYGPNDNFNEMDAHVLPALIRRFQDARANGAATVTVWGSGKPRREFLFVDDLADALVFLMRTYSGETPINIGTGVDVTIAELAGAIQALVGYRGRVEFDSSKPDGTPRKLLDVTRLSALGWRAKTELREGLELTYRWYRANESSARGAHTHA
jgi:GDP-L-fucose synthase